MKKTILILTTMILGVSLFAEPADNFKAAGIGLGGSISLNLSSDDFLNDDDKYKDNSSSFNIRPNFEFMMVDNISLTLSPEFGFYTRNYYNWDNSYEETYSYTYLGANISATYYITTMGYIVPFAGIHAGLTNYSWMDGIKDGGTDENKSNYNRYNYGFELGSLYFLTDRLAIRGSANLNFSGRYTLNSRNGDTYEYSDDYDASQWLDMNVNIYVGISYYFPNSESLIVSEL